MKFGTFAVTLTLNTVQQSFQETHQLMVMCHCSKFVCKKIDRNNHVLTIVYEPCDFNQ